MRGGLVVNKFDRRTCWSCAGKDTPVQPNHASRLRGFTAAFWRWNSTETTLQGFRFYAEVGPAPTKA